MINHVKCCTEIEQHEQRDTAVVDWADQIVMNNEHYSLCGVEESLGGLLG